MNKKELIERIRNLESESEDGAYQRGFDSAKYWCLTLASNLEESKAKKVEVPDFVAEWFESRYHINQDIYNLLFKGNMLNDDSLTTFEKWFYNDPINNFETLIRMKDGYKIKIKPKRWVVKVGNLYFCGWEDTIAQFVMNTMLGEDESIIKYKNEGTASSVAKNLGGIVETLDAVATLVDGSVEEI